MSKKAFDKISEGLSEALSVARGQSEPARLHIPPEIDVRSIRHKTELSQDEFASTFGFSVHQIRQWEQGRNRPLDGSRAYLMLIDLYPDVIKQWRQEALQAHDEPQRKCG
ncbi:helix-turn-helix domain-containing protein [Nguyenibacter vanlangensis]|uniref:helix-turn-helix domain-containing protein n=1 Tax=Nguyenibacter vanlangensis TaxID=1216886 RepID=UPI001C4010C6|nr:transcriptional regulator [Nguyenibacter vanlangensis]